MGILQVAGSYQHDSGVGYNHQALDFKCFQSIFEIILEIMATYFTVWCRLTVYFC